MGIEEYWMGKGIDLDPLWNDFDSGKEGYISKVSNTELYILRLTFEGHPIHLPLFDHELIYKTVKNTFHDAKYECLNSTEYNEAIPIFLYKIDRGSGIYEFIAQYDPIATYVSTLVAAYHWYNKDLSSAAENDEKRFEFIQKNFPDAPEEEKKKYITAWNKFQRRKALERLMDRSLSKIEISQKPINSENANEIEFTNIQIDTD